MGELLKFVVPAAVVLGIVAAFVLVRSLSDGGVAIEDLELQVRAEIVETGSPVSAQATAIRDENGLFVHGVRITWQGQQPARLDDARFTQRVEGDRGDLVTAGRGCGADWDEQSRQVVHICTADLQIITIQPGGSHEYPVRVHPRVGPLRLAPGTYVLEEQVQWWRQDDLTGGEPEGSFTIRLTYEVRAR